MSSYLVGGSLVLDVAGRMPILGAELLKGTVLLLLAFGGALVLRRSGAAVRHLLWSLVLSAVLLLPLLSATIPWRVGVLPAAVTTIASDAVTPSSGTDARTSSPRTRADAPRAIASVPVRDEPVLSSPRNAVGATASAAPFVAEEELGISGTGERTRTRWTTRLSAATLPNVVVTLWLVGALLLLVRLAAGLLYVRRLLLRATIVDDDAWLSEVRHACMRLGVRQPVLLLQSADVAMPITCGLLTPRIVLPAAASSWSSDRRRAVLLHEMAHVSRNDVLTHCLARVVCALYWFHPLVWAAARRLRAESERACDDRVLRAGTHASEYAEHLLHIVRAVGRRRAPVIALPLAQLSEFEGRLIAILEPGARRHAASPMHALSITLAVSLTALPLAAMGPARSAPATAIETSAPFDSTSLIMAGEERAPSDAAVRPRAPEDASAVDDATAPPHAEPALDASLPADSEAEAGGPSRALIGSVAAAETSRAVTQLIATLRDPHPDVRIAVVRALGQLEDPAAVPALAGMFKDDIATVRTAAAQALGEIEDPRAIEALSRALREDSDAEVRKTAAWALGEIDDKRGVPALLAALAKDRDVQVRKTAAWALGEIEDASAVDGLGAALRDEGIEVRRTAVWALGEIEDARAVDFLLPALKDSDTEIRRQAAWALGEIESARAIDGLGASARDADTKVREQSVWALGEIEDRRALPILAAALRDAEVGVRRQAAWAIGELDDLETAPPALIEALKDTDREVRKQATHALGELGDSAAVPGLAALARGDDAELRRAAVSALSEIGGVRALELLVDMLKDDDPEIRKMAAEALGNHR